MFSYLAYGLGIQSEILIPEFMTSLVGGDVTIRLKQEDSLNDYLPQDTLHKPWSFDLTKEKAVLYLKNIGIFIVENGNKIEVIPAPEAPETLLRLNLVGNVMSIILYQRGLLALHASAVKIDDGAVAFLGVSGRGKSSTAAAFHAQGYTITNDDVAPVTLGNIPPTITPGFPQIKMSREIANALGYDFESLNLLHPGLNKRGYRQIQDFPQTPLPIHHLYVLSFNAELGIELISPQQAVIELSRYAHPEILYYLKDPAHFLQCATLAQQCKIYRLKRPRDLSLLPKVVELVAKHVSNNLSAILA